MGWDRGYYYRSRREGKRVCREYLGKGTLGELVAQMDALERQQREAERVAWQQEKAEQDALDADLQALERLTDLAARAALVAAGYRQHKRGEWRKQREHDRDTAGATADDERDNGQLAPRREG